MECLLFVKCRTNIVILWECTLVIIIIIRSLRRSPFDAIATNRASWRWVDSSSSRRGRKLVEPLQKQLIYITLSSTFTLRSVISHLLKFTYYIFSYATVAHLPGDRDQRWSSSRTLNVRGKLLTSFSALGARQVLRLGLETGESVRFDFNAGVTLT